MDFCFEALSLDFGRRHVVFLEPEVTIFGREGSRLTIPDNRESSELTLS